MRHLATRAEELIIAVDSVEVAAKIDEALEAARTSVQVFIDIDPGLHRTGVVSPAAAVQLTQFITWSSSLHYRGVQFYCGPQQHVTAYADRRAQIVALTDYLEQAIAALKANGLAPEIISGGGTGTHRIDLEALSRG